jgi:hypothetical protein
MYNKIKLLLAGAIFFCSCTSNNDGNTGNTSISTSKEVDNMANYLTMKINGQEWKADHEIIGSFHPKGYDDAIIIAGSKGPKDKNEQTFNLTLYKTDGPGVFEIKSGNKENNIIQLAGLSEQQYIYGSMMGFNVKVNITKASNNPTIIEANFEGEMTGNASDKLILTEGQFYYHE